jgi:hypothetical protein
MNSNLNRIENLDPRFVTLFIERANGLVDERHLLGHRDDEAIQRSIRESGTSPTWDAAGRVCRLKGHR